jgi:hypothetical protein
MSLRTLVRYAVGITLCLVGMSSARTHFPEFCAWVVLILGGMCIGTGPLETLWALVTGDLQKVFGKKQTPPPAVPPKIAP